MKLAHMATAAARNAFWDGRRVRGGGCDGSGPRQGLNDM